jgi:hypothetical protein
MTSTATLLSRPVDTSARGCVHQAADPAAALHACLDGLGVLDVDALGVAAQAALLRSCSEARLAGLRLRLLAAAERSHAGAASGAASTVQWAAKIANADPAETSRQVALALDLDQRSTTRLALAGGTISRDHAAVIVQTDRQLPAGITVEQRDRVEAALVARARDLAPGALRRVARRALAEVEADPAVVDAHEDAVVADEESRARSRTRLTLHDNDDGTVSGHFTVPTAQGHLLRKVLQTITAPRRARLGASRAQAGDNTGLHADAGRARGEAFCELLEHLPTEHLHPATAATLVVTVPAETLRGALVAAHLDTGEALSAGEARRLACNARLLPAVLGRASLPLDLGRSARLFSEPQRTALGLVHRACAADGCDRPLAWCELHHLRPWARGGRTDLDNAVPLCHFHHQRIHDRRYENARAEDGSITFVART